MMITSGDLLRDSNNSLSAQSFRSLPLWVKEKLTCRCKVDYCTEYVFGNVFTSGRCTRCWKPRVFQIRNEVRVCDGCEDYYIRPIDWVPADAKWNLCRKCDSRGKYLNDNVTIWTPEFRLAWFADYRTRAPRPRS